MARVLVPLASGCEELEAVTIIDLLRRAGVEVISAGLTPGPVTASRGTMLLPDTLLEDVKDEHFDLVVLPGGLPGADYLEQDVRIKQMLTRTHQQGHLVAAICAAPKVLASAGLLDNCKATAYPGVLDPQQFPKVSISTRAVEVDGKVITSKGPGTAMDFALTLIECLCGLEKKEQVAAQLQRS